MAKASKKESKRNPLLIDSLSAAIDHNKGLFPGEKFSSIKSLIFDSKKFVFDDEASSFMGSFIHDMPEIIAQQQEFALLPYQKMYVEIPFRVFYKACTGKEPDETSDLRIGYLFGGSDVHVLSQGYSNYDMLKNSPTSTILLPYFFELHHPLKLEDELKLAAFMEESRIGIDTYYWGESWLKLSTEDQKSLRRNHGMRFYRGVPAKFMFEIIKRSAGDLRNIVASILFLNRTGNIRYEEEVAPKQGMIKNKVRTLLKHSIIRFKLAPKPRVLRVGGSGGVWRREHDVMAHFCHNRIARESACNHDWVEYGVNQWKCLNLCGGLKWRRKEHRRGHKEKGRVESQYEVVK